MFNQDDLPRVHDSGKADYSQNDHYTTKGQVESGKRYAAAMIELLKADKSAEKITVTGYPFGATSGLCFFGNIVHAPNAIRGF